MNTGVDLDKITWMPTDEEHVAEFKARDNVDHRFLGRQCADLLASGELDAAIGDIPITSPDVEARSSTTRARRGSPITARPGIYPVNHGIVLPERRAGAPARARGRLVQGLLPPQSRSIAPRLDAGEGPQARRTSRRATLPPGGGRRSLPPSGIANNRKALEALTPASPIEQHMIPRPLAARRGSSPPARAGLP